MIWENKAINKSGFLQFGTECSNLRYNDTQTELQSDRKRKLITDIPSLFGQAIACEMHFFGRLKKEKLERQWEQLLALIGLYEVKNIPLHAYKVFLHDNEENEFLDVAYQYKPMERNVFKNTDWNYFFVLTIKQYNSRNEAVENVIGLVTPSTLVCPSRDFEQYIDMESPEFEWLNELLEKGEKTEDPIVKKLLPYFSSYLAHIEDFWGGKQEDFMKAKVKNLRKRIDTSRNYKIGKNYKLAQDIGSNFLSSEIAIGPNANFVDKVLYYCKFNCEENRRFLLRLHVFDIFESKLILLNQENNENYRYDDALKEFGKRYKYKINPGENDGKGVEISVHSVMDKKRMHQDWVELSKYSALIPFTREFVSLFCEEESEEQDEEILRKSDKSYTHDDLLKEHFMKKIYITCEEKNDEEYFEVILSIDSDKDEFPFVFSRTYSGDQVIRLGSELQSISIFPKQHVIHNKWTWNYFAMRLDTDTTYSLSLGRKPLYTATSNSEIYQKYRSSCFLPASCNGTTNYFIAPLLPKKENKWRARLSVDFGTSNTYSYLQVNNEEKKIFGSKILYRNDNSTSWLHETFIAPQEEVEDIIPTYVLAQDGVNDGNKGNNFRLLENINAMNINYKSTKKTIDNYTEYSNLKWPEWDQTTFYQYLVIEFLSQITNQAAAAALAEGADEMEVFFSYPMALDADRKDEYIANWNAVCSLCENETGLTTNVNDSIKNNNEVLQECVATAKYFIDQVHTDHIMKEDELFVIVDIGGGTSDISFVYCDYENHNTIHHTSVKYAGRSIVFDTITSDRQEDEENRYGTLSKWFQDSLNDDSSTQSVSPFVKNLLNQLAVNEEENNNSINKMVMFEQIMGSIIAENSAETLTHLKNIRGDIITKKIFEIMRFKLENLIYVTALCLKKELEPMEFDKKKIKIFLAGNGSKLFKFASVITKDYEKRVNCQKYLRHFADGIQLNNEDNIEIVFSKECKKEVAKGLIHTDIHFETNHIFELSELKLNQEERERLEANINSLYEKLEPERNLKANIRSLQNLDEVLGYMKKMNLDLAKN